MDVMLAGRRPRNWILGLGATALGGMARQNGARLSVRAMTSRVIWNRGCQPGCGRTHNGQLDRRSMENGGPKPHR